MRALVAKLSVVAALVFLGPAQVAAQAEPPIPLPAESVDGTTFAGTFELIEFVYEGGVIRAVGLLTGTLVTPDGEVAIEELVSIPLTDAEASCDLLHLELGPVDLDLLGLDVELSQIVLDIDAEAAPGNLLGNLLCATAHLLDSNASGRAIVNRLNKILSLV